MIAKKIIPDFSISEIERIFTRIVKNQNDCWIWQGAKSPSNHSRVTINYRQYYVHRITYKLINKIINVDKELDHLCREPMCVNPKHLEEVNHKTNSQRGNAGKHNLEKTHCPSGHEYSGFNLRLYSLKSGSTARTCRACMKIYGLNRKAI